MGLVSGRKLPRSSSNRLFVKQFAGDDGFAIGGEHGGLGEPLLDELQGHEPVVHPVKGGPGKFDHVHFHALVGQAIKQRADERDGVAVLVKRAVDEVDAEEATASCWRGVFPIEHPAWMMIWEGSVCGTV